MLGRFYRSKGVRGSRSYILSKILSRLTILSNLVQAAFSDNVFGSYHRSTQENHHR